MTMRTRGPDAHEDTLPDLLDKAVVWYHGSLIDRHGIFTVMGSLPTENAAYPDQKAYMLQSEDDPNLILYDARRSSFTSLQWERM